MKSRFYIFAFFILYSCSDGVHSRSKELSAEKPKAENLNDNWQSNFDFDGDKIKDSIITNFTGGANCCYTLSVNLSKSQKTIDIPFLIDGGYMIFNLSKKENFNIKDYNNDKIYEILINLEHFERDFSTDDFNKLKKKYSFQSNKVIVDLSAGKLKVKDY